MKYLVSILIIISCSVKADIGYSGQLTSFYELLVSPRLHNDKTISVRGYLLKDDRRFYFCVSMETCFARGKERVKVVLKPDSEIEEYLNTVDECHMELSGTYKGLSQDQSTWPFIGYLYVDEKPRFDFNSKYSTVNTNCRAFNQMKE